MIIVITGGSKGIGKALATVFLQNHHTVIVNSSNKGHLDDFYNDIKDKQLHHNCYTYQVDMTHYDAIADFCTAIKNKFNAIDVLINNAGIYLPGLLHDVQEDNLGKLLNINLMSAYHCSRNLIPLMQQRRSGHIVNICSVAGMQAYPNGGAYSVSKFAMIGLSKGLREELKPYNIKVTSVMPGATLTDSWSGTELPADRFIDAIELASVIYTTCTTSARTVVEEIVIRPMMGDI